MYIAEKERYLKSNYNYAGNSGLKLPDVSLGLWHNFGTYDDFSAMKEMIFTAFDNGVTMFDIANNYGALPGAAEENFGKILHTEMQNYRDEMLISTKAGYTMWDGPYGDFGSRKYLLSSLDQSLKRLGLDYVDIFYHHRMDKNTPLEETMEALNQAVKSGKALYAGISNYNAETTVKATKLLNEMHCPFVLNQVRYSMLDRHIEEDGLLKTASEAGVGLIIFSPLEQGLLSDRYLKGIPSGSRMTKGVFLKPTMLTDEVRAKILKLNEIAKSRNQTLAQMALSWVMNKKEITSVIIGASSKAQILENLKLNKVFDVSELVEIDKICKNNG